ncbi:hypothetical protein HK102_011406 [Quaeritorhiza haematococci]|nr:hypothetical protein HK102_011406 [Quaeritorhiza haematococci]
MSTTTSSRLLVGAVAFGFIVAACAIFAAPASSTMLRLQRYLMVPRTVRTDLFGGSAGWNRVKWMAVDDRVRGGSSKSNLTLPAPPSPPSTPARFYGHLDTTTLGGAGFASQRTIPTNTPQPDWDLSGYDGIEIEVARGDGKRYAFNIQTQELRDRGDGRIESAVTYKYSFTANPTPDPQIFFARWSDFVKTYRGRPAPDSPDLDRTNIRYLSIMCQSYFDQQSGDFELEIRRITAVKLVALGSL